MTKKSTLAAMTKTRDLAKYVFEACDKAPRKYRFSLCQRIGTICLKAVEDIYLANANKDLETRISYQEKAMVNIAMTDYFANLALSLNCFTEHQYEVISLKAAEAHRLTVAWLHSSMKLLEEKTKQG